MLEAASEAELALLIEFLGRPPSGLLWLDRRVRRAGATHAEKVAAVVEEVLRCSDHSVKGRLGAGQRSYLQVVCDVLQYLELDDTPADGVLALELRVVRYVLDSEFERLAPDLQATLMDDYYYAGKFFVCGIRGYGVMHSFVTQVDPDHREFEVGKIRRALKQIGGDELQKRVKVYARQLALRLVVRRLAGPIGWAITGWELLGPAYRLVVPTVCYVAYLRHHQQVRAAGDGSQARAAS